MLQFPSLYKNKPETEIMNIVPNLTCICSSKLLAQLNFEIKYR
jgi:hypothetical protein